MTNKKIAVTIAIAVIILISSFYFMFQRAQPQPSIFPLWVLDNHRSVPEPEMNITLGTTYSLTVGGENLMGNYQDCLLLVKLRDMSSTLPYSDDSALPIEPSTLPKITDFTFALDKNETWETPFNFAINLGENETTNSVTINGSSYIIDLPLRSPYQFFFELWLKDQASNSYTFSGIYVSSPFLNLRA